MGALGHEALTLGTLLLCFFVFFFVRHLRIGLRGKVGPLYAVKMEPAYFLTFEV